MNRIAVLDGYDSYDLGEDLGYVKRNDRQWAPERRSKMAKRKKKQSKTPFARASRACRVKTRKSTKAAKKKSAKRFWSCVKRKLKKGRK
jgi:hypothetical protein